MKENFKIELLVLRCTENFLSNYTRYSGEFEVLESTYFKDMGFDSLLFSDLLIQIGKELKIKIPDYYGWDSHTIETLSKSIMNLLTVKEK